MAKIGIRLFRENRLPPTTFIPVEVGGWWAAAAAAAPLSAIDLCMACACGQHPPACCRSPPACPAVANTAPSDLLPVPPARTCTRTRTARSAHPYRVGHQGQGRARRAAAPAAAPRRGQAGAGPGGAQAAGPGARVPDAAGVRERGVGGGHVVACGGGEATGGLRVALSVGQRLLPFLN